MGPIFFIADPPASGKTTVSRLLLARFPKGIHVLVDAIRESVVSGFRLLEFGWPDEVDEQFALARSSATHTARTYYAAGRAAVVDDTLGPGRGPHIDISQHADLLKDATVHRVALRIIIDSSKQTHKTLQTRSSRPPQSMRDRPTAGPLRAPGTDLHIWRSVARRVGARWGSLCAWNSGGCNIVTVA